MYTGTNSVKNLFQKRLQKSKSFFNLPNISNTSLHFFRNLSNKSTISNQFFNKDLFRVRQLDINSKIIPFKLLENNSNISEQLENKRNQFIKELKTKKKNKIISEEDKQIFSDKYGKKNLSKLSIRLNEKILKNQLLTILEEINKLKKEKENIKNKINESLKKIESNEVYLDIIKSENDKKTNQLKEYDNMKNLKKESFEEFKLKRFNLMSSLQREFEENQVLKNEFLSDIELNKENIKNFENEKLKLKKKLLQLKTKYSDKKKVLIQHYHYLLFEGLETRKEGLSWIIRAIWDLDEDVNMSFIPNFLDEKAIEYLFLISNKLNYISDIEISMSKVIKENSKNITYKNLSHKLFKTNIFKDNVINLKLKLKNIKNKKSNEINYFLNDNGMKIIKYNSMINLMKKKKKEKKSKSSEINNEKIEDNFKKYESLKQVKCKLLDELDILKKKEVKRITREFLENDYERRFNVPIEIVLSALVGEFNLNKEYEKQKIYRNEYIKNLKDCNFYRLYEKKAKTINKNLYNN